MLNLPVGGSYVNDLLPVGALNLPFCKFNLPFGLPVGVLNLPVVESYVNDLLVGII